MLMSVEADAVAKAVRKEFVSRAIACGIDNRACCVIHCSGEASSACGVEGGILCFAQRVEDFDEPVGWFFPKNDGARYIGLVSFDLRASIDQNYVAGLQRLRLDRSVRQRCRRADQYKSAALQIHFGEALLDPAADVVLRHSF